MRLRSLHRAYPSLHPSGVVHWVPEQLNCNWGMQVDWWVCSLALCSATVSGVSAGICHRNKVNSIAWLYRKAQPKDSIIYITLHYIYYKRPLRRGPPNGGEGWMVSVVACLTAFSSERWGGKVYPGTATEDLPRMIVSEILDNTLLRLITSLMLVSHTKFSITIHCRR